MVEVVKRKVIRQGAKIYRNYTITIPKLLAQIHGIKEGMEIELKDTTEGLLKCFTHLETICKIN